MNSGFWQHLPRPFTILAPMAGVTDTVFRQLIAKHGKPSVLCTWFVSCDGLCSAGRPHLLPELAFAETERPIVAQVFGARPEPYRGTAELLRELRFDGIDINAGCPDRNVEKQGAGAALIRNPELLAELYRQAVAGAGPLPVSIKTRLGYDRNILDQWLNFLLDLDPPLITIHARTRDEMSDVPAQWDQVARAVEIARRRGSRTLIVGNGDVMSLADAGARARETGADGVMIGRGIFGNPWFFNPAVRREDLPIQTILGVMVEHTRMFFQTYGEQQHFDIMKKHYKAYAAGFPGAKDLRVHLMESRHLEDVERIVAAFLAGRLAPAAAS